MKRLLKNINFKKIALFFKAVVYFLATLYLLLTLGRAAFALGDYFLAHATSTGKTEFDVVLECQKISATQTNEGWGYKSCIENLGKTIRREQGILRII